MVSPNDNAPQQQSPNIAMNDTAGVSLMNPNRTPITLFAGTAAQGAGLGIPSTSLAKKATFVAPSFFRRRIYSTKKFLHHVFTTIIYGKPAEVPQKTYKRNVLTEYHEAESDTTFQMALEAGQRITISYEDGMLITKLEEWEAQGDDASHAGKSLDNGEVTQIHRETLPKVNVNIVVE